MSTTSALSQAEVEQRCRTLGWKVIGTYVNASTPLSLRCVVCRCEKLTTINKLQTRKIRCICVREKAFQSEKLKIWGEVAMARGGRLITTHYKGNRHTKYLWECGKGHIWESSISSVIGAKSWCPTCAGKQPRCLDDLKKICEERGGSLTSTQFKGVDSKYDFECNLGHRFTNTFKHVEGGQWCPICSKGSKSEELTRVAFEQIFGGQFIKSRPIWLRNEEGRQMELDGYNKNLKIAFEYQGRQHSEALSIYLKNNSREEYLKKRIRDDEKKRDLCSRHHVFLFELSWQMKPESFLVHIKDQAIKFGLDTSKFNFETSLNFSKAYIRDDRLEELRTILALKKIDVLSTKWIDVATRYELRCQICGNTWKAQGNAFFNNRRTAGCKKCAMTALHSESKLGLTAIEKYAEKFGGKVLSQHYIRRSHVYDFSCSKGHLFKANFNNMVYRNQFCPVCEGRQIRRVARGREVS